METEISLNQAMKIAGDFFKQIECMDNYSYNAAMLINEVKTAVKNNMPKKINPDAPISIVISGSLAYRILDFATKSVPSAYEKVDLVL